MLGTQRLCMLWACVLLAAALSPGALCKRSGGLRGWAKGLGLGSKSSSSSSSSTQSSRPSKSSSKTGLKLAGAAAGVIGGGALGYGLGSLGKNHHYGNRRGHSQGIVDTSATQERRNNQQEGFRHARSAAGAGPGRSTLLVLMTVLPLVCGHWNGLLLWA